ncbi:MAG: hypothetical protein U9Q62_02140 [Campylobacterota bacterium]|nr:hypothetical protein [Campylobacterota bacterium]
MIKLSPFLLILTIPFLSGEPYAGLPLWGWGSLAGTVIYAITLIYAIEKRWDRYTEHEHE